jgi:ornithine cyclodeaminase/alanine dehydrogenase-like protein (mu-crystallin family)
VTLLVERSQIAELIDLADVTAALRDAMVEQARRRAEGGRMPIAVPNGAFHIVGGSAYVGGRHVMSVKTNARLESGVTGVVLLFDVDAGELLAIMDSARITQLRTAALTAIAVEATTSGAGLRGALLGAGRQAQHQLDALASTGRLGHVTVWDIDPAAADRVAARTDAGGLTLSTASDAAAAVSDADVVVSITPSRAPLFPGAAVRPGTTLIALGADAAGKQELDPALLARARVVTDDRAQCARFGELQHAHAAGLLTEPDSTVELLDVVAGSVGARVAPEDIVVVDSTGTALQDGVAAWLVLDRASRGSGGATVALDR